MWGAAWGLVLKGDSFRSPVPWSTQQALRRCLSPSEGIQTCASLPVCTALHSDVAFPATSGRLLAMETEAGPAGAWSCVDGGLGDARGCVEAGRTEALTCPMSGPGQSSAAS